MLFVNEIADKITRKISYTVVLRAKKINMLRDAFHRRHLFSVVIICGRSSECEYISSTTRLYVFENQRL